LLHADSEVGSMFSIAKIFDLFSRKLLILGGALMLAMVALTCVDVVGRMMGYPVFGAYELMSFMAALVATAALPDTHLGKRHIGVEILTNRFSTRTQLKIELITDLIAVVLFSVVTWRMFVFGRGLRASGEVSMNLGAPEYLITYAVGYGFLLFTLAIVKTICGTIQKLRES
jgi:TRAP-type C4-dicarboxylate transport system permease small subunit